MHTVMGGHARDHGLAHMIGLAACMIGHDRSWAVMHAVMNGQVMDASTMIDHGGVHGRSWGVMHTVMVGHARGYGRPCTR